MRLIIALVIIVILAVIISKYFIKVHSRDLYIETPFSFNIFFTIKFGCLRAYIPYCSNYIVFLSLAVVFSSPEPLAQGELL